MGQVEESFRDKLIKMAESAELMENVFSNNTIDITIEVKENEFNEITNYLNTDDKQNQCIISMGKTNFIFSKK